MKRSIIVLFAAAFAVFAFAGTSMASTSAGGTFKDGPYTATTPDSGCVGNNWAQDLFVRNFVVTLPAVGGVFAVTEKFQKGRFSTYAGDSPGAGSVVGCSTNTGGLIKEGVVGKFSGFFTMSISGGTFNPNGSCDKTINVYTGWQQCDTAGWVKGFFGAGATYSVDTYKFNYSASGQGLIYNAWQNADPTNGGNTGDISS